MSAGAALFIDPPSYHFEEDKLFGDGVALNGGGVDILGPFAYLRSWLRERDVQVHTADMIDRVQAVEGRPKIYVSFGMRERYGRLARRPDVALSGLFAFECPIVEPRLYRDLHAASRFFRGIYSFSTEQALEPFLTGPVDLRAFRIPQAHDAVNGRLWSQGDRRFLVMINANKVPPLSLNELYTERLRAVAFFADHDEVDLYGVGWDGPVLRVGDRRLPGSVRLLQHRARRRLHELRPPRDPLARAVQKTNRGPVDDKAATLAGYTFALCFENSILEGWITEKIFDCFYTGTIPVYLGAPDVERWIPPECFIDMRRFADYGDLRAFLRSLSPRDVEAYRVAARDFLVSDLYRPFTKRAFAELIGSLVEDAAGTELEPQLAAAG